LDSCGRVSEGWRCRVVLTLFAFRLSAADTYEQELSSALTHRVLIFRNYYTDAQLTFDSSGQPVSKATRGFGASDGRIHVQRVQLEPGKLTLSGTRPLDVFEPSSQEWQVAPTATTVSIEMLLPAGEAANAAVPYVINTVFLKKSEVAEVECTAAEQQEFIQDMQDLLNHPKAKKASKLRDATSLADLQPYCLPGVRPCVPGRARHHAATCKVCS
jgi:hypothetical protein